MGRNLNQSNHVDILANTFNGLDNTAIRVRKVGHTGQRCLQGSDKSLISIRTLRAEGHEKLINEKPLKSSVTLS
jgi:hypothetical protein